MEIGTFIVPALPLYLSTKTYLLKLFLSGQEFKKSSIVMDCKMYAEAFWKKLWRQVIIYACVCVCRSVMLDSLWPPMTVAHQNPLSLEFSQHEY